MKYPIKDQVEGMNKGTMYKDQAFLDKIKTCKKCGHMWLARIKETRQCPKCHTARWNIERAK